MFPFPLLVFDSDNGSEFINHDVAEWLQERDIAQTRSRPEKKNDRATVESKNNNVVSKRAFYWRYDTSWLLNMAQLGSADPSTPDNEIAARHQINSRAHFPVSYLAPVQSLV